MSVCKNCTREISEAEIVKYFEGEGYDDLEQQINKKDYDEPSHEYEPGDKINPVPLRLKNMKCPNCKNKLNDCAPFEVKVDIEEEWFDDYGHGPDQSSSFIGSYRYTIIQEDRNPFLPSFNHKNLKETSGNLSLLIIAKTKMYGGHCYLGLNLEDEIIYRPIYKEEPGTYESNFISFCVVFRKK